MNKHIVLEKHGTAKPIPEVLIEETKQHVLKDHSVRKGPF
ncbi:hypothetical protein CP10881SC42_0360 [Chlamydia avium]|uniref:Uncharacterized protein n=1 Tax=Chlamydia avium TaxID=1457141 RepID=A0ABN0MT42_9CHLA|nr:hypothetical protein CP10743SC13_0272 [Chlamydia psittaci 10_743_SC13]EPP38616.1 hypothetical protein CP10881SC42_0360 [Chlamydia avium]